MGAKKIKETPLSCRLYVAQDGIEADKITIQQGEKTEVLAVVEAMGLDGYTCALTAFAQMQLNIKTPRGLRAKKQGHSIMFMENRSQPNAHQARLMEGVTLLSKQLGSGELVVRAQGVNIEAMKMTVPYEVVKIDQDEPVLG